MKREYKALMRMSGQPVWFRGRKYNAPPLLRTFESAEDAFIWIEEAKETWKHRKSDGERDPEEWKVVYRLVSDWMDT